MEKSNNTLSWLAYERCTAAFHVDESSDINVTVLPNVSIKGSISGIKRQIDVLIDSRWSDDQNRRIIIDAKLRSRKVDIKAVESFEGMMKDCAASRGIIVCNKGYTSSAFRRAQDSIVIKLLTPEELEGYEWIYEPCQGGCDFEKGRGMVLWGETLPITAHGNGPILICQTGICDGCHNFHLWCWDCGLKFVVPNQKVYTCDCGYNWISYFNHNEKSRILGLVLNQQDVLCLDRCPIT